MKVIVTTIVVCLIMAFGSVWLVEGNNFFLYAFFAPKQEAVRREVYEQTKSYRKGLADRLSNLCGQLSAEEDADRKTLIRGQIAQEFSDVNTKDVPDYLGSCLSNSRQ